MTEKELILLGLKSEEIKEHDEDESYYYVLDIVDGITLITPTSLLWLMTLIKQQHTMEVPTH